MNRPGSRRGASRIGAAWRGVVGFLFTTGMVDQRLDIRQKLVE